MLWQKHFFGISLLHFVAIYWLTYIQVSSYLQNTDNLCMFWLHACRYFNQSRYVSMNGPVRSDSLVLPGFCTWPPPSGVWSGPAPFPIPQSEPWGAPFPAPSSSAPPAWDLHPSPPRPVQSLSDLPSAQPFLSPDLYRTFHLNSWCVDSGSKLLLHSVMWKKKKCSKN